MEKNTDKNLNKGRLGTDRSSGLDKHLFTLFSSFSKRPENKDKSKTELIKEFTDFYNIKEPLGLLEQLSGEMDITFDTIKEDGFSLRDIISQENKPTQSARIHLMFSKLGNDGKKAEKILIQLLTEKLKQQIPEELKKEFSHRFSTKNIKTLNTLSSQLTLFFDEHTNILRDTSISISNEELKNGLVTEHVFDEEDVSGSFNKRTGSTKTLFDKIVSHQRLEHLRTTATEVEKQSNSVASFFGNIPSMKDIIAPFATKNLFKSGEYAQERHDLQEKIAHEEDEEQQKTLKKELYRMEWRTVITEIEKQNKPFATALEQAVEKNFDFSLLSKEHQTTILHEMKQQYVANILNSDICTTLGLEKHSLIQFIDNLFDLNKTEIAIPLAGNDGLQLSVKKSFRSGTQGKYVNLQNINTIQSPFIIDIHLPDKENQEIFESTENVLFRKHFVTIHAKNGDFRINEQYKIKIDDTYEGYLHYPYLLDDKGDRLLDEHGEAVMISQTNEQKHTIEILERTLRLEGNDISLCTQALWLGNTPLENPIKNTEQDKEAVALFISSLSDINGNLYQYETAFENQNKRIDALTSSEKKEKRQRKYSASISEVYANADLGDNERITKAIELLNKEGAIYNDEKVQFSKTDIKGIAILEAHRIGEGEIGDDGKNLAGVFNYTEDQLKRKIHLLKNAGFTPRQIKILLQDGICGKVDDVPNAEHRAEVIVRHIITTPAPDIKALVDGVYDDYISWNKATKQAFDDKIEEGKDGVIDNTIIDKINDFFDKLTAKVDRLKNKDYDGLLSAFGEFKVHPDYQLPPKNTTIRFLNFMRVHKGQKPGHYYGYNGSEILLSGDLSSLELPTREEIEQLDDGDEAADGSTTAEREPEKKNFSELLKEGIPGHPSWVFEKGARLRIKSGLDSKLPPDTSTKQWIQLEVMGINETTNMFRVKVTGGELSLGSEEGKEFDLPMDKQTIENLGSDVYRVLSPNKDFNEQLKALKASGVGMPDEIKILEEDIAFKGNGFEFTSGDSKGEKVAGFGTQEIYDFDPKKGGEQTQRIFYDVKHNANKTFTVESKYIGFDDDGDKHSYNYKQTMDYNSFILFIATKKIKPKTEAEADIEKKSYDKAAQSGLGGRKLKFFGIMHVISAFKEIPKKIKEGLKKYQEKQKDEFTDFLVSDMGIYKKLNFLLGWSSSMKDAITNIEVEYYNERDAKTRKQIEFFLKIYEADPDFGDSFDKKGYGKIIMGGHLPKNRFMAAALLLANIGPGGGPYARLQGYRMKGQWVKLLLGEGHHQRFMQMQKEHMEKMKNEQGVYGGGHDANLTNELVRCEMMYLVNNIGGRSPGAPFGSIKDDNGPKRMRSDKFAGELEKRFNGWISRSAIEERYGNLKQVTNFNFCYGEYKRYLFSGRRQHAMAYFKKMATLASPQQISQLKKGMLYGLVSGAFLQYADKPTKGLIEEISRSMGFAPGLLVQQSNHPGKIAKVLDHITGGNFSSKTKFNEKNFGIDGALNNDLLKNFITDFEVFRQEKNNGNNICKFFKDLPKKNVENDPLIIQQMKKLTLEENQENSDPDVAKNKNIIVDSVLTKPKGLVNTLINYSNGSFAGKDNDEIQASQKFWNNVAEQVKKTKKDEFSSMIGIFLNWFGDKGFGETEKESFLRKLAAAKKYKDTRPEDARDILWYAIVGEITLNTGRGVPPQELKKALLAFKDMFWNYLDSIDGDFVGKYFGKSYVEPFEKKHYKLAPWKEYHRVMSHSNYFYDDEVALGRGRVDSRTKEEKAYDKEKESKFRNEELFLNKHMLNQERQLERKGGGPVLNEKISTKIYENSLFGID